MGGRAEDCLRVATQCLREGVEVRVWALCFCGVFLLGLPFIAFGRYRMLLVCGGRLQSGDTFGPSEGIESIVVVKIE